MRTRLLTIFSAAFFLVMLAGCGQAGPLYLPGDAPVKTPPQTGAQTTPAPDNDKKTQ